MSANRKTPQVSRVRRPEEGRVAGSRNQQRYGPETSVANDLYLGENGRVLQKQFTLSIDNRHQCQIVTAKECTAEQRQCTAALSENFRAGHSTYEEMPHDKSGIHAILALADRLVSLAHCFEELVQVGLYATIRYL
jgi:hypothetical protein